MRARAWLVVGIIIAAAMLLAGRAVTSFVVELQWYRSLGAERLWWERVTDTAILQGGLALCGAAFAFLNLTAVRSTILAVAVPQRIGNIELTTMVPGQRLIWLTAALSVVIGIALAVPVDDWTLLAMARHGIAFREIEFYHGQDLGFYVYWLPLETTFYLWALVALVVMTALVMICYALTRSLRMDGRRIIASSHVRRHMSALGALVMLLLAWSYRLDAFELLRNGSGREGLFMRVDHIVTLRVDVALSALCAIAAILLLRAGWLGQVRASLVIIGTVLVGAIVARHGFPALITSSTLLGEPGRRESDYIATRALVSRRAFDVDGIRLGASDTLAAHTRLPVALVPSNVSHWDAALMRSGTRAMSGDEAASRTSDGVGDSGDAGSVDVGAPAIVVTSAGNVGTLTVRRPLSTGDAWKLLESDLTTSLPAPVAIEWRTTMDSVAEAEDFDRPREPLIAPGIHGHVLVNDRGGDIPGPHLRSLPSRIAHAWSTRDPSLLNADSLPATTVLVSHRDVRERVQRVAPVFAQGTDVLPLLNEGLLYWTVELYSTSDEYPLSEQWVLAGKPRAYFRHAGTALVESATGKTRIIATAKPDPIARTWMRLVPSLWVPQSDLPADLVDQLPPITDGAIAQIRTFARHGSRLEGNLVRHFTDSAFGTGGIAALLVPTTKAKMPAWSLPLLDENEELGGVMTVVGGRVRETIWDSTAVPRMRWPDAVERLHRAIDSARAQVPNGSRREPRVRFGQTRAVMTVEGPLLIQALHVATGDGGQPIARFGVLLDDRAATGARLVDALALASGLSVNPGSSVAALPSSGADRDATLNDLYTRMREALKRGDWTHFGAAFDSLGRLLGRPPN